MVTLRVENAGDRPIQVGSHYHFAEANPALSFDRAAAYGCRLDIPAGTAVRFEPGVAMDVDLVPFVGARVIPGLRGAVAGPLRTDRAAPMSFIDRQRYRALYGPTTGDRIRLADTDLWIEVTHDHCVGGDEVVFGGGKVIRESMGQSTRSRADGAPDLVITGVVILDHWGIVKADVGVRDGRIVGIGKAGNPDTMDGIDPALVIGPSTEVMSGNGRIMTAGAIDSHVHLICPQQLDEALGTGITTIIGGGTGPAEGTKATTVTGAWHLERMLEAIDQWPVNVALLGKGNTVDEPALWEQLRCGAAGFKLHEDWGNDPGSDRCLPAGRRRLRRAGGDPHRHPQRGRLRREHAGGDRRPVDPHVPHRRCRRWPRPRHHDGGVVPQRAAVVDEPDAAAHRQHRRRAPRHAHGVPPPEPVGAGGSRVRRQSDSSVDHRRGGHPPRHGGDLDDRFRLPGHGPIGEVVLRTWQTAHVMKVRRGSLEGDGRRRQPARPPVRRQVHDLSGDHPRTAARGRVGRGRQARRPGAVGPGVLRGAAARRAEGRDDRLGDDGRRQRVDPDTAAGTPRPMFGAAADVAPGRSVAWVAQAAIDDGLASRLRVDRQLVAVADTRQVAKRDMPLNDAMPDIRIEPDTFAVYIDGELITEQPAEVLPMAQRYFLF